MVLVIKHIDIEGPGSIADFFGGTTWGIKVIDLSKGQELPRNLGDIDAVVSLGGPMSVYEEKKYPFLKEEDAFLKSAVKEEIPILGICLGAQMLAKACTAAIAKAGKKEIGWQEIRLTAAGRDDRLFSELPEKISVFQWHEDTFDIPQQGILLAEAPACRNQAFRFGRNAYGLQFHIEVNPEMIASWIEAYAKDEADKTAGRSMLVEAYRKKDEFLKLSQIICLNFSRIIAASQKAGVS